MPISRLFTLLISFLAYFPFTINVFFLILYLYISVHLSIYLSLSLIHVHILISSLTISFLRHCVTSFFFFAFAFFDSPFISVFFFLSINNLSFKCIHSQKKNTIFFPFFPFCVAFLFPLCYSHFFAPHLSLSLQYVLIFFTLSLFPSPFSFVYHFFSLFVSSLHLAFLFSYSCFLSFSSSLPIFFSFFYRYIFSFLNNNSLTSVLSISHFPSFVTLCTGHTIILIPFLSLSKLYILFLIHSFVLLITYLSMN